MAQYKIPSCSFCQKNQKNVNKLIAGPNDVFICNECIDLCNHTIRRSPSNKNPKMSITEEKVFCLTLQNYDPIMIDEMKEWLEQNVKSSWINEYIDMVSNHVTYKIIFENESDLVV